MGFSWWKEENASIKLKESKAKNRRKTFFSAFEGKKVSENKKKLFNSICGLNGEETKLRSEGASVNVSSV